MAAAVELDTYVITRYLYDVGHSVIRDFLRMFKDGYGSETVCFSIGHAPKMELERRIGVSPPDQENQCLGGKRIHSTDHRGDSMSTNRFCEGSIPKSRICKPDNGTDHSFLSMKRVDEGSCVKVILPEPLCWARTFPKSSQRPP